MLSLPSCDTRHPHADFLPRVYYATMHAPSLRGPSHASRDFWMAITDDDAKLAQWIELGPHRTDLIWVNEDEE